MRFQSRRCTQDEFPARLPGQGAGTPSQWLLRDQDSDASFLSPLPVGSPPRTRMVLETAEQGPEDHRAATDALRALCQAAVQTGHAIEWY